MKNNSKYWIVTDLDGTLMDEDYDISPARKTLKMLAELNIPVMCYGIRTDFQGMLFEGSQELLAIADNLKELKTICSECDKKATMVVRIDENGKVILEGEKILIGGNEVYKTLCRK